MSRANCIWFSVKLYYRRKAKALREGRKFQGYLALRRSHSGPFPHLLYVELAGRHKARIVSYGPVAPREKKVPPPLFVGRVRWGDPLPHE